MADAAGAAARERGEMAGAAEEAPQWEMKKENVAPMRKGVRDVAALNRRLQAQEGLRGLDAGGAAAREERTALWERIKAYDGGDPIEPWLRLISWTQRSFVGGRQQAVGAVGSGGGGHDSY